MSETEHTPTRLRGMYRVEGIAPVNGWSLFQSDEYDGDGFHYLSYAAARGDEVRQIHVSRFSFDPSQSRFCFIVKIGFPAGDEATLYWSNDLIDAAIKRNSEIGRECIFTERFWSRISRGSDCWEWQGSRNADGYGTVYRNGKIRGSHRVAYEIAVGPIYDGLQIDHLCRNPACCRIEHLEPVSRSENVRRGILAQITRERCAKVSHCKRGHEYTPENTYRQPATGRRSCRICKSTTLREKQNASRVSNRSEYNEYQRKMRALRKTRVVEGDCA